jgi:hypothetical protein
MLVLLHDNLTDLSAVITSAVKVASATENSCCQPQSKKKRVLLSDLHDLTNATRLAMALRDKQKHKIATKSRVPCDRYSDASSRVFLRISSFSIAATRKCASRLLLVFFWSYFDFAQRRF